MTNEEAEKHNAIVPEIVQKLVNETGSASDCMVALESVIVGVMLYYRPDPRDAGEYLDMMTIHVINRLKPLP